MACLKDRPRGGDSGSRLPEVTRRAILMIKEAHPDWGGEKISALLLRGPALPASPQNSRVYLVAFLDVHSRFLVGYHL